MSINVDFFLKFEYTLFKGGVIFMVSDVIKEIMKSKGLNNIQMAEMLGIKPQSFSNKLFRDSYTVDELIKILDILDCKLIIQPKPELSYTLSSKNSSKVSL